MVRAVLLLLIVLSAACVRPISRAATATPVPEATPVAAPVEPSPTPLPAATVAPSETPRPAPTPTPLPEDRPLVRAIEPLPGAEVPQGEVRIAAEVIGRSSLTQVIASLNALPVSTEIEVKDARTWSVVFNRALEPGAYEVRVVALDDQRRMMDRRWQFKVLPPPTPTPTPTLTATPSPGVQPSPTASATLPPTVPPARPRSPTPTSVASTTPVLPSTARPTAGGTQPVQIRMPLVRGMREQDARAQLQALGLKVQSQPVRSPAPNGIVVDQSPNAGIMLNQASTVSLSVSGGQ